MTLVGVRNTLRAKNLYDTGVPEVMTENPLPAHPNVDIWRTPDGTSNDLKCPFMGSAGTRFGRNAPLSRDMAGANAWNHESKPACGKPRTDDSRDLHSGDDVEPVSGELAAVSDTRLVQPWAER